MVYSLQVNGLKLIEISQVKKGLCKTAVCTGYVAERASLSSCQPTVSE
jgi:hypothetical protein